MLFQQQNAPEMNQCKAFNIMASAQFFATQSTPGSFKSLFACFSDEVSR